MKGKGREGRIDERVGTKCSETRCSGLRACSNSSLTPGKSLAAPKYLKK